MTALEGLYQDIIVEHSKNPSHKGLAGTYDAEVHHVNPTCGDEVTLRVSVVDGIVSEVTWDGQGCSISQASASVMSELVTGRPVTEALETEAAFLALMQGRGQVEPDEEVLEDAVAFAGVAKFPARVKCALLGWMAWKDATAQAVAQQPKGKS